MKCNKITLKSFTRLIWLKQSSEKGLDNKDRTQKGGKEKFQRIKKGLPKKLSSFIVNCKYFYPTKIHVNKYTDLVCRLQ